MNAVIFDVDGTLVDSVDLHARAWRETFLHFGKDIPLKVVRSQIGKGGDQLLPVFLSQDELGRDGAALERHRSELFKTRYLDQVKAFPRVRDLFHRLIGDGHRVALASSAKGDELETYKRRAGIADLIAAETSSDDAARSKPYPDIFQAALARLQLPPDEALVVGDTPYDAQAARRAGIPAIGLRCGGFPERELAASGFFALHDSPADLLLHYEQTPFADRRKAS